MAHSNVWLSSARWLPFAKASKEKQHTAAFTESASVNTTVTFYGVCAPMFTKCWDSVENPSQFPMPFPVVYVTCLWHVYCRRFSPLSLEVVEKTTNVWNCLAPIFFLGGTDTPTFQQQNDGAIYYLSLAKFAWVLFADLRVRSLCSWWQWSRMQNLWEGEWKRRSNFKLFVDQSSWKLT